MISDLKPYPEYKESGLPWLGQVPGNWKVSPLAGLARQKSVVNETKRQLLSVYLHRGVVRFADVEEKRTNATSEDLSKYQAVDPGDFVLNNQQAWRGSVGVSNHAGIVSPAYLVLALSERYSTRYANILFRDQSMVSQYLVCSKGVGTIQRNLYWPHLKRVGVVVPPLAEQAAIVRFLDWANGRLERAIRAKRKVIALLNEQKQAIIHRAVTRGLDPSVPLKPSGIPWFGDIPQHWSIRPMKRVVQVKDGTHDTPPYVEPSDRSFPLVTSKDFGPSTISFDRTKHISEKHHREVVRRSNTERGDVLMSMIGGNIGKALIVDTDREFSIKNVALFKSCDEPALARFVLYYLQSGLLGIQIALLSKGGAQGFLGLGQIRNLQVAMMPANEMEDIVQALDMRLRDYDGLIAALRNSNDLVTEYRTRLVADVVTGKLDVREAAARLPEGGAESAIEPDRAGEDEGCDELSEAEA